MSLEKDVALLAGARPTLYAINSNGIEPCGFETAKDAAQWAQQRNAAGSNIYWPVNGSPHGLKAKKTQIADAHYLHVDLDPADMPGEDYAAQRAVVLEKAHALLNGFEPRPAWVIDSGHGLNVVWRLAAPVPPEVAEQASKALALKLGASPMASNVDRILRLPGLLNYPNATKLKKGYPETPAPTLMLHAGKTRLKPADVAALLAALAPVAVVAPATAGNAPAGDALEAAWATFATGQEAALYIALGKAEGKALAALKKNHAHQLAGKDLSGSGLDMSLAHLMRADGFNIEEIEALLEKHTTGGGGRSQGARYWRRIWNTLEDKPDKDAPVDVGPGKVAALTLVSTSAERHDYREFALPADVLTRIWLPEKFVVEDHIPAGRASSMDGPGGSGKTMLVAAVSHAVSTGSKFFGLSVMQGKVAVLTAEDLVEDYGRRIAAYAFSQKSSEGLLENLFVADLRDMHLGNLGHGMVFYDRSTGRLRANEQMIGKLAETFHGFRLIFIETKSRVLGMDETNPALAALVDAAAELAKRTGAAVTLTGHVSQEVYRTASITQYSARGGTSQSDNARANLVLTPLNTPEQMNAKADEYFQGRDLMALLQQYKAEYVYARLALLTNTKSNFSALKPPMLVVHQINSKGPYLAPVEGALLAKLKPISKGQRKAQNRNMAALAQCCEAHPRHVLAVLRFLVERSNVNKHQRTKNGDQKLLLERLDVVRETLVNVLYKMGDARLLQITRRAGETEDQAIERSMRNERIPYFILTRLGREYAQANADVVIEEEAQPAADAPKY